MLTKTVSINAFDYSTVGYAPFIALTAKRNRGKSTWKAHFATRLPQFKQGTVAAMCGSESTKEFWEKQGVHPLYIVDPSIDYLQNVCDRQNKRKLQLQASGHDGSIPAKYCITILIDDCSCLSKLMKSAPLSYIASNGRHLGITIVISAQYITHIPADVRTNIDILVVLATSHKRNITKIYDEFASASADMRVFKSVLAAVTDDYGALIIDNTVKNVSSIENNCFYGKIEIYPVPRPRLKTGEKWYYGGKESIEFARKHYVDRNKILQKLSRDDNENEDEEKSDVFMLQTLNNRRVFTDGRGRIVVKTCAAKQKLD